MPNLSSILSKLYLKCIELDWSILIFMFVAHYLTSFFGMHALGEAGLIKGGVFAYYYFTTVSTVGYGDLSPVTENGRLFYMLILLPGGLTLFTLALGKAAAGFSAYFRKKAEGMGDYSKVEDATVVVGYRKGRTDRLIAEILAGSDISRSALILLTIKDKVKIEDGLRIVKAESFSSLAALKRASIEKARQIVVDCDNDDLTITAVLAARSLNKSAHLVCYLNDPEKSILLTSHCQVEIIYSSSVDLIARELTDPGSSDVVTDLLSAQTGVATFGMKVPEGIGEVGRSKLSAILSDKFGAILVASKHNGGELSYDPRDQQNLCAGDQLYYISPERITLSENDWRDL